MKTCESPKRPRSVRPVNTGVRFSRVAEKVSREHTTFLLFRGTPERIYNARLFHKGTRRHRREPVASDSNAPPSSLRRSNAALEEAFRASAEWGEGKDTGEGLLGF